MSGERSKTCALQKCERLKAQATEDISISLADPRE